MLCDSTWDIWASHSTDISDHLRRKIDAIEGRCLSHVTHIFTTGKYVKENLVEHYRIPENNITVVGTGLGKITPYEGIKDYRNKKILFIAKERFAEKGGHLLINAFRQAHAIDPELRLTIVGGAGAVGAIPDHPGITVLGFIPWEQLQGLFNTHSLYAMPALSEPWGLVYLEALKCRMPILGLNRCAFPEISGNGAHGLGFDLPDAGTIAQGLVDAFRDPERLENMGSAGSLFCAKNFSWEKTVDSIIARIDAR